MPFVSILPEHCALRFGDFSLGSSDSLRNVLVRISLALSTRAEVHLHAVDDAFDAVEVHSQVAEAVSPNDIYLMLHAEWLPARLQQPPAQNAAAGQASVDARSESLRHRRPLAVTCQRLSRQCVVQNEFCDASIGGKSGGCASRWASRTPKAARAPLSKCRMMTTQSHLPKLLSDLDAARIEGRPPEVRVQKWFSPSGNRQFAKPGAELWST